MFHDVFHVKGAGDIVDIKGGASIQGSIPKPSRPDTDPHRLRFCEQVNYSTSFSLARRMCLAAQHSTTETQELIKVLQKWERDMLRRQKRADEGKSEDVGESVLLEEDLEDVTVLLEDGECSSTAQVSLEQLGAGKVLPPVKEKGARPEKRCMSRGEDPKRGKHKDRKGSKDTEAGKSRNKMRQRSPSPLEVGGGESCPSAQGRRNASVAATWYGEEDV